VGIGLSRLWAASKLEDPSYAQKEEVSNSMGLFLQKTNIIRDYLEDLEQGRTWWPKEIWRHYGESLGEFRLKPSSDMSLACLNHMVADALSLVPDCLEYLNRLKDQKVFEFCAIPQVMAIATLAEVYNNPKVFTKVVKVRKGLSCRMMLECQDMNAVRVFFRKFMTKIESKVPRGDPSSQRIAADCVRIRQLTASKTGNAKPANSFNFIWWVAFACILYALATLVGRWMNSNTSHSIGFGLTGRDWTAVIGGAIALFYLTSMSLVGFVDQAAAATKDRKLEQSYGPSSASVSSS